jgi:hypothetical protein
MPQPGQESENRAVVAEATGGPAIALRQLCLAARRCWVLTAATRHRTGSTPAVATAHWCRFFGLNDVRILALLVPSRPVTACAAQDRGQRWLRRWCTNGRHACARWLFVPQLGPARSPAPPAAGPSAPAPSTRISHTASPHSAQHTQATCPTLAPRKEVQYAPPVRSARRAKMKHQAPKQARVHRHMKEVIYLLTTIV